MWEIIIRKADNGFIVSWVDELEDGTEREFDQVFEEYEKELGEMECMINMLHFVKEYFGVFYSKHNKHNVHIGLAERGTEDG